MAPEIVGREDEVAALHVFVGRAGDGPAALVVEGEPGIGKTTLWLAGVEAAHESSVRVLAARPAEAEQGLAHAALADLLERWVDEVLPMLAARPRRALEVALLLDDGDGTPADPRALGVAVQGALRALAVSGPVVVAVDDLQWLDASSTAALTFAMRRLDREPVRLLIARRTGGEASPLEQALSSESVERLHVGPLSLGALQRLIRRRTGSSFPRSTVLRLQEVSGGNPFFALELARALDTVEAPIDPAAPLPVPETLDRLVGDRLRILTGETRAALLAVAVVGSPSVRLLEAVGVSAETLESAVAAQVLEVADGQVGFVHPLLASAVLAEAEEDERRRAHRVVATVVDDPVGRARHVAAALECPDDHAAGSLEDAAGLARTRGAASVAAELGEAAMRATPVDREDDRRRRGLQAARDYLSGGSADRAFLLARPLLEQARPGHARAEALVVLADLEDLAGSLDAGVKLLLDALPEAAGRPELQVGIHQRLALTTRITEGLVVAEHHARAALRLSEQLEDDALTACTLAALATVRFNAGQPDSFAHAERALRIAHRSGDRFAIAAATAAHAHCLVWSGRLDAAHAILTASLPSGPEDDGPEASTPLFYLTLLEQRAGRLSLARGHAERLLDLVVQLGEPELGNTPTAAGLVASVAVWQGELDVAREFSERALAHPDCLGPTSFRRFQTAILGQVDAWSGGATQAVERFSMVERERRAAGFSHATSGYVADYLEALLQLGRARDATAVLEEWERDARGLGHPWALAQTVRCRGLVAAAAGDLDGALALLEQAVLEHEAIGDPLGRARALLALGVTRRRARQKRRSREAIEEAAAEFERAGAAGWAEKARAELGSIGGRTREEGLTPAERRVAELVAEGRTNREVAAALFLGERTVETHLTHVYAKLGIRSRTELARSLG